MKRKALIVTLCLAALTAVGSLGLPWFSRSTNCGGNTAAWSNCRTIYSQLSLADKGNEAFAVQTLPQEDLAELAKLGHYHWTGDASFLIKKQLKLSPDSDEIIAFCDTNFDNVPQPTIYNLYKRTPRYAVTLANGKTKLIAPEEFAKIDHSQFVKASDLVKSEVKP